MEVFRQWWTAFLILLYVSDFVLFLMIPIATYFLSTHRWPLWKAFGVSSFVYLIYLHVIWRKILGGYPLFGAHLVVAVWAIVDGLIPWHVHQPRTIYWGHSELEVTYFSIVYSSIVLCVAPTMLLWVVEKYIRPKFRKVRKRIDDGA